jgi:hypothetical protein
MRTISAPFPEPRACVGLFEEIEPTYCFADLSRGGWTCRVMWGEMLSIRFAYDPVAVETIRRIPGREWDPEAKKWTVRCGPHNVREIVGFLREFGFTFDGRALDVLREAWER